MRGQAIERGEGLRFIGLASAAGTFPGFQRRAFARSHNAKGVLPAQPESPSYDPRLFSPEQFRMVEQLAEMIIPATDVPGAKQTGVAEFIGFMVAKRVRITERDDYQSSGKGRLTPQENIRIGNAIQQEFVSEPVINFRPESGRGWRA